MKYKGFIQSALTASAALKMASPTETSGADGRRTGRRTGNALEFAEYREYLPGDDLRRLDWRVYARSGQMMTRQYNEETEPRCDLVLDHSASMSLPYSKAGAAMGLAAMLASAAVRAGFSINLWHAGAAWAKEDCPEDAMHWSFSDFEDAQNPAETLPRFPVKFLHRGIRIAVSDFLWQDENFLTGFSSGASKVILLSLDFPPELPSPAGQNAVLEDSETGETKEICLDSATMASMESRLYRHRTAWQEAADRAGAEIIHITEDEIKGSWAIPQLIALGVLV